MIFSKIPNIILLLSIVAVLQFGNISANEEGVERKILDQILDTTQYDRNFIPKFHNETSNEVGPVKVAISMYVLGIQEIDERKMQFGLQLYFRQGWLDSRLKYSHLNGNISEIFLSDPARIWKPDTFFANEISGHFHQIAQPNVFLRISPSGEVLYSVRLSVTLSCPMNHQYYPHGKQVCTMELESYGYSTRDIAYHWRNGKSAVGLGDGLGSTRFNVESFESETKLESLSTGNYSRLVLKITFEPLTNRFLLRLYLPSIALIVTSWITFWLNPSARIERTSLALTTVLTMIFLLSNANAHNPSPQYSMLIDHWNTVCCIFVFAAFIESLLVSLTANSQEDESNKRLITRLIRSSNKFDTISRVLFPIAFIIFLIFYCCQANN